MSDLVRLLIAGSIGLFLLDLLLRWMEGRGWIYYRKTKPGRSAIAYHVLEMGSVFNPSFKVVQEIQVEEEKREEEAGDPLGPVEEPPADEPARRRHQQETG